MNTSLFACVLLGVSVLLVGTEGCSCPSTRQELYCESDVVMKVEVISHYPQLFYNSFNVSIIETYKANSGSNTTRSVVSNMSSCGVMLDVQETYILFATVGFYDSSKLHVTKCGVFGKDSEDFDDVEQLLESNPVC